MTKTNDHTAVLLEVREALETLIERYASSARRDITSARSDCPDFMPGWTPENNNVHVIAGQKALTRLDAFLEDIDKSTATERSVMVMKATQEKEND